MLCEKKKPLLNSVLWKIECDALGYIGILSLYLIYNHQFTVVLQKQY